MKTSCLIRPSPSIAPPLGTQCKITEDSQAKPRPPIPRSKERGLIEALSWVGGQRVVNRDIPRSKERGLIEASLQCFRQAAATSIPRSKERGLIEAEHRLKAAITYRDIPRSKERGLIEALKQPEYSRQNQRHSAFERTRPH